MTTRTSGSDLTGPQLITAGYVLLRQLKETDLELNALVRSSRGIVEPMVEQAFYAAGAQGLNRRRIERGWNALRRAYLVNSRLSITDLMRLAHRAMMAVDPGPTLASQRGKSGRSNPA